VISRKICLTLVAAGLVLIPALGVTALGVAGATGKSSAAAAATVAALALSPDDIRSDAIAPAILRLALGATSCATRQGLVERPETLTVIDYSKPSTEPRLWVLDLTTGDVLFEERVAHGEGSGDNLATRFSNEPDSHQSSLGLFLTGDTYSGKHGYSLRLHGLEPGVNDRALERAIVMHGAAYVSTASVATLGRLGRSWGCPALASRIVRPVIDRIKGGSLMFAYYPDQNWLETSKFLNDCNRTPTD
jgi:L,D-transpeptidase catalytic domain